METCAGAGSSPPAAGHERKAEAEPACPFDELHADLHRLQVPNGPFAKAVPVRTDSNADPVAATPNAHRPVWRWQRAIDCGKGSLTVKYAVNGLAIDDAVVLPDNSEEKATVVVFPSSTALPKEWSIDISWTAQTKQIVTAKGGGASGPGKLFVSRRAAPRRQPEGHRHTPGIITHDAS